MNFAVPRVNLEIAWLWIVLGFVSGMLLGLFFQRDEWLGGYASLKRRLYRLAHISFFGLGAVNLCFFLTVVMAPLQGIGVIWAGWALILGALSMPICCILMAHIPRAHLTFGVPVISLIVGGVLTLTTLMRERPQFPDTKVKIISQQR